jgi:hypothetical protein
MLIIKCIQYNVLPLYSFNAYKIVVMYIIIKHA